MPRSRRIIARLEVAGDEPRQESLLDRAAFGASLASIADFMHDVICRLLLWLF